MLLSQQPLGDSLIVTVSVKGIPPRCKNSKLQVITLGYAKSHLTDDEIESLSDAVHKRAEVSKTKGITSITLSQEKTNLDSDGIMTWEPFSPINRKTDLITVEMKRMSK